MPGRAVPGLDRVSRREVIRPEADLTGRARAVAAAPSGRNDWPARSFQWSREMLAAGQLLRGTQLAAAGRAEALRVRVAATIADVAAVEERIARMHEVLAAEGPGNAGSHRRIAADARGAVRRAAEIRAQLAVAAAARRS